MDATYKLNVQHIKVAIVYTALMVTGQILAGFALGFIRTALGGEDSAHHVWGAFDSVLVTRLIGGVVVAYAVYWRLLQRHTPYFLQSGLLTALLSGLVEVLLEVFRHPEQASPIGYLLAMVANVLIFVAVRALIWPHRNEISSDA